MGNEFYTNIVNYFILRRILSMSTSFPSKYPALYTFSQKLTPIGDAAWVDLERRLSTRSFAKGDLLVKPGDVSNYVSFILQGKARLFYPQEGREVIVGVFFENEFVTDYDSFLSRKPSRVYVEFLDATSVVELHYHDVQQLYDLYPELQRYGRLIAENLYKTLSETIASMMLDNPEIRYQRLQQHHPRLLTELPQYMVASLLGITPEALSRLRSRLLKKNA
jgi:CRP-like cAMP-binding protein